MMTIGTLVTQMAVMRIISLVATDAGLIDMIKFKAIVAALAALYSMHAQQWKMSQIMIKQNITGPTHFVMTITTIHSQGLMVDIVFFMTGHAALVRNRQMHVPAVALVTTQLFMGAPQWKLSTIMIKLIILPAHLVVTLLTLGTVFLEMNIIVTMTAVAVLRQIMGNTALPVAIRTLQ